MYDEPLVPLIPRPANLATPWIAVAVTGPTSVGEPEPETVAVTTVVESSAMTLPAASTTWITG